MSELQDPVLAPRIWQVGALCRAIADALEARFNPVAVRGEVSGFSRASSGHCYFSLKDPQGQIRCAMFRRAAGLLEFVPRDGEIVEVLGRLDVYAPRGDLQLIVESLSRAGPGALFEKFLQLKARLEAQGLFDPARKRPIPVLPRGIGLVTSPGAAALHDVVTALRRRAPHVPVVLAPAAVQGPQAPAELIRALSALYRLAEAGKVDVILLVRGGGSIEDLWGFNSEQLARTIVLSPVPLICGVGHETDFTIADFCADVRAPTPTAAAELAAEPRDNWLARLQRARDFLGNAMRSRLDSAGQRLDVAGARLGRPLARMSAQQLRLGRTAHRLRYAVMGRLERERSRLQRTQPQLKHAVQSRVQRASQLFDHARLRLQVLDPRLVLERGYALLTNEAGQPVSSVAQTHPGQALRATLADGEVALTVTPPGSLSS
ncbi:MAG TPA: exodeoxyribonuclease VII large subunit [Ramlibacter sp.]|nr:exodeoxyribonuclease VII large subunit [Ramlibacter sp.]